MTFSRTFPSYHPKAGQPTFFVEKFINSMFELKIKGYDDLHFDYDLAESFDNLGSKHHTIRAGHRFKVGDKFSPRVWGNDVNPKSGRRGAYHSKQIIIAPDVEVKQIFDVCIWRGDGVYVGLSVNNEAKQLLVNSVVSRNDGLELKDFEDWFCLEPKFKKTNWFDGQIICWNENVNY